MKSLLSVFAATTTLTFSAQARTVNFLCEAGDQSTLNRFTGSGLVEIENGKSEGNFSGATIRAGKNVEPIEIGELAAKGEAKIIPPGEFAKGEVIVLQLAAERDAKPVRMIFNLGISGFSSTFIVEGVPFKAQCSEYK